MWDAFNHYLVPSRFANPLKKTDHRVRTIQHVSLTAYIVRALIVC